MNSFEKVKIQDESTNGFRSVFKLVFASSMLVWMFESIYLQVTSHTTLIAYQVFFVLPAKAEEAGRLIAESLEFVFWD